MTTTLLTDLTVARGRCVVVVLAVAEDAHHILIVLVWVQHGNIYLEVALSHHGVHLQSALFQRSSYLVQASQ